MSEVTLLYPPIIKSHLSTYIYRQIVSYLQLLRQILCNFRSFTGDNSTLNIYLNASEYDIW